MPKCKNCNAEIAVTDDFCPLCGVAVQIDEDEVVLNGVSEKTISSLIDRKSEKYMEIFRKNESKDRFVSFNFAAFFFGPAWFAFRKMYKKGVILCAVETVLSFLIILVMAFAVKPQILKLNEHIDGVLQEYEDKQNEELTLLSISWIMRESDKLSNRIDNVEFLTFILLRVLVGLFANSVYRNHLVKNYETFEGGTSMGKAVLFLIIVLLLKIPVQYMIRLTVQGVFYSFI